jgi:hypothetical protein
MQEVTAFLGLVQVKKVDAASLCQRVLDCLDNFGIPLDKVLYFGSDEASVITGTIKDLLYLIDRLFDGHTDSEEHAMPVLN